MVQVTIFYGSWGFLEDFLIIDNWTGDEHSLTETHKSWRLKHPGQNKQCILEHPYWIGLIGSKENTHSEYYPRRYQKIYQQAQAYAMPSIWL